MDSTFKNFYRNFYQKTGGFIPAAPLNQAVFPGDFFQIRNGEMMHLGNIFRNNIISAEDAEFGYGMKLNPASWNFSDGVTKPYSGRGSGSGSKSIHEEFEFSKLVLAFGWPGSFLFKANLPESVKIMNWNELEQQLIIKLTQTIYSFREVYVATESATAEDWTLAVASSKRAELEIATETENFAHHDIFGHYNTKTIQSKEIEYYNRESKRKPVFFKAKKLITQDESTELFISQLIQQRLNVNEWASKFFEYDFHYEPVYTPQYRNNEQINVLDLLQANELNPNTALRYFKWADMNTDDIERLFLNYGG